MRLISWLDSSPGARACAVVLVLSLALALRLYGIDWDQGYFFHPDERFILQLKLHDLRPLWPPDLALFLNPTLSPWNPHWFAYGSFPFYVLKGLEQLAALVAPGLTGDGIRFLGRGLSALADTGTVLLVYLLGSRLYGWRVGLLAMLLSALAVLQIQLSHFAAFDPQLTFWIMLALYAGSHVAERGSPWASVGMGVAFGLALATKISVLMLAAPVVAAHLLYVFLPGATAAVAMPSQWARASRVFNGLLLMAAATMLVAVIAQPYALLDLPTFLRDTQEQTEMALRVRDYPYTRQYIDTSPYLYQFVQLSTWGLGWPLGLAAWGGLGYAVVRAWRHRAPADLLLLAWVLPYFLITGPVSAKFLRYMLPLTPVLLVFGARLLLSVRLPVLLRRSASHAVAPAVRPAAAFGFAAASRPPLPGISLPALRGRALLIGLVVLATAWYALAYTNIYRAPHPAVRVSTWLNEHVTPGQLVLKEHWEEGLPQLDRFKQEDLPLYEPDTPDKLNILVRSLGRADYLVFFSDRLYGTIPRLPERYPMSTQYYRLLFSGALGYELAYQQTAYASFLGVTLVNDTYGRPELPPPSGEAQPPGGLVLNLGHADESYSVYDHPKVMAFRNNHTMSETALRDLLSPALPAVPGQLKTERLLLDPDALAAQRAGGTWSQIFQRDSWANRMPVVAWLGLLELLGLLAFPWVSRIFTAFPDRGYLLGKTLGVLALAYPMWLLSSLRLAYFSREFLIALLSLLAIAGILAAWWQRASLAALLRRRWRYLAAGELVFLAAFTGFLLLRSLNPDLWHPWRGGEKPMDFAYLNAVVRSSFMPPYDPWYAGGYINYYYFGQFIVATLIKLTGILPEVSYNLAIPTLFALAAASAVSLGGALAAAIPAAIAGWPATAGLRRLTDVSAGPASGSPETAVPIGVTRWLLSGLATAVGILIVGNLDGAVQLLDALREAGNLAIRSTIPGLAGLLDVIVGAAKLLTGNAAPLGFDYWRSRGMGGMDPTFIDPVLHAPSISITEFPFFTFLFADLHAHLMVIPLSLLSLGLGVQLALGGLRYSLLGRLGVLALAGLVLGAVRWTNSWDYPTALALLALGLLCGELYRSPHFSWRGLLRAGGLTALVLALSLLWFVPFQRSYELFYGGGLEPSPEQTRLSIYLRIHGLFIAALISFLAVELVQRFRLYGVGRFLALVWRHDLQVGRAATLTRRLVRRADPRIGVFFAMLALLLLAFAALALVGAATAGLMILLLGLLSMLGVLELTSSPRRGPAYLLVLGLAALAALISLAVDVVKLDIPGEVQRMNNVFKLYLQVWLLYAVAAAFALAWVLAHGPALKSSSGKRLWAGAMGLLVAGSLVYPALATPVRLADRFTPLPLTLDGTAYMAAVTYPDEHGPIPLADDAEAIRWLQDNVVGSPVVLEASIPIYRWGSRVSVYTGLPTVLGWDWHQSQQRWDYRDNIDRRKQDVTALYTNPDPARAMELLRRYQVRYIYVGQVERVYYPEAGLRKFQQLAEGRLLRLAHQNPSVRIYEVVG